MVDILQTTFRNSFSWLKIIVFWIHKSQNDKSALVQGMAWCRAGDKPLPELMMPQYTDTYVHFNYFIHWLVVACHIGTKFGNCFCECEYIV